MRHTGPESFINRNAIGYTRAPNGLPLETFDAVVPSLEPDDLLIGVVSSSLNPLDYKLADLNFLGRTPPVVLGFDFAGAVIACGSAITRFAVGDAVLGMVPSNRDGVWVSGGRGSVARIPEYLITRKPADLSWIEAGALGICFLSAELALSETLQRGATIYVPGGGGGVGHMAIQKARSMGARLVLSSGSSPASRDLARVSGADHVFDYRSSDVAAEVAALTNGAGVDVVFDATYSEGSFVATSQLVGVGGRWVVLGVGPGKTSRGVETQSPVDQILAAKHAQRVDVNLLRYFAGPTALDRDAKTTMSRALGAVSRGDVRPHIAKTISSEVDAINQSLDDMKSGRATLGKVAVVVDRDVAGGTSAN
jgi:NADPH:quinone reductase-like Zn-dependent oxidoreductase